MTQETYQALAKNILAADEPWWAPYARREGHDLNLFDNQVPFDRVHELLAGWEPRINPLLDQDDVIRLINEGHAGPDLITRIQEQATVDTHKRVKTQEGSDCIGIEQATHLYGVWLSGSVREVLGDEVVIKSAGLLRKQMQAFVTVARPQPASGPAGIVFSPFITLSTSLDASMSTQINQSTTLAICDNTLNIARGQGTAFRHTSGSNSKLGVYRGVLDALNKGETSFTKILDELAADDMPDDKFSQFLQAYVPIKDDDTPVKQTRSRRKRQEITQLYRSDARVMQWTGTKFGALQAVNTWETHMSQLCNRTKIEMDDTNLRAMKLYQERLRPAKRGEKSNDEKVLDLLNTLTDSGHRTQFATV